MTDTSLTSAALRSPGQRNRLFGWSLFLAGILYGMALGLFVFDGPLAAPERFADYASLPRRLIRFAHIACMALGMVNVLYGHEIDRIRLSERWRRIGSASLILSGTLMPVFLTLAAFQIDWKWGLPVPGCAALVAVVVVVAGLWREEAL
jgi:ribose/xylose/arabinose/galactoside ABC-type transport system permease subunit